MNDLQYIQQYFADPVRFQCINQHEVENLSGVERGTIQTILAVDDAISEENLKAIAIVLKMI